MELLEKNRGADRICPACYMRIDTDSFQVSPGSDLHSHPVCVSSWYSFGEQERGDRLRRIERFQEEEWLRAPVREGFHWARIPGCSVLRKFTVVRQGSELLVSTPRGVFPLSGYRSYEFLPEAA